MFFQGYDRRVYSHLSFSWTTAGRILFSQDPVDPAAESERVLLAADTVVAYFENRGAGKTLDTKII